MRGLTKGESSLCKTKIPSDGRKLEVGWNLFFITVLRLLSFARCSRRTYLTLGPTASRTKNTTADFDSTQRCSPRRTYLTLGPTASLDQEYDR
ncbi:hypothetical protein RRG08_014471 [Elysia crispata]|uniref:Uncharacterized protein n=1 Tax=Elysia crispata TaxID=231223 RepID=A0AAE0Y605_9GAST|nr:hypothetical protein RRG08_014471 [Elysia crispata]